MLRKIFNRRKHPRYFAEQNTFLVFQPCTPNEKKLQIHDISEGGCGFLYHGSEHDLEKLGLVAIANHKHIYFEGVKILTVNDQPASGPFRRRGIVFKWPGGLDKKMLTGFIRKVSICKCC